jgi:hypothetical protein
MNTRNNKDLSDGVYIESRVGETKMKFEDKYGWIEFTYNTDLSVNVRVESRDVYNILSFTLTSKGVDRLVDFLKERRNV